MSEGQEDGAKKNQDNLNMQGRKYMEIRSLDKETYAGEKFTVRYKTNGYYDISASGQGFRRANALPH